MSIKTNTTDLQALLEVANNLPVTENLNTELSTQDSLIAQIMTALEGKTAGGGAALESVTVRLGTGAILLTYYSTDGTAKTVPINATNGSVTDVVKNSVCFAWTETPVNKEVTAIGSSVTVITKVYGSTTIVPYCVFIAGSDALVTAEK